jgi:UDP-N-acetylmuramyl tripeptide synthase
MADEPHHGFDDSRRLTGPNRYFGGPAVTLRPLGRFAQDPNVLGAWAGHVRAMAAALGWPDPQPTVGHHAGGSLLVFRAPADVLLSATDLNEWAWERAAAEAGESEFDLAQDLGAGARDQLAARAGAERDPRLAALRTAAGARGLPVIEDDERISVGAGTGSRCWSRAALPAPDAVPWNLLHDVPTVLVTGSNGKTTTVRLLAAMARAAGLTPGLCSTEGVFVADEPVATGDYSGPEGARLVLRHPEVQAAILEAARGGILRRGLAVRRAGAAVITNISADHFGEYGIDDAAGLAETKLSVAHTLADGGTLVLNADDATLMAAAARLPHVGAVRRALFAANYLDAALLRLRAQGGDTCGVRDARLILGAAGREHDLGAVHDLPLTVGGAAPYNIANLAAASLAAAALKFPTAAIIGTVQRFGAGPRDNPGRLEQWRHRGAIVLIDYAHNPDALAKLLRVARALRPRQLALLLGQAGNRDDAAIADLAATAARFAPDRVILKELPLMLRGRAQGEVPVLLERALTAAGMAANRIMHEPDEESAARRLLDTAEAGDVIVLPIHTRAVRERLRQILT